MTTPAQPIYLDHNATTPILPEVVEAMLPFLREHFGNPSSRHPYGERSERAIAEARASVAGLLGVHPDEIVFTSGGTEANNLAIRGIAATRPQGGSLVTSSIEHPATREPCRELETRGWKVTSVAVDSFGRVDAEALGRALRPDTALVTVMHANNETGTLQPIREIAARAHAEGVPVHTDAAQSIGKVSVDARELDVDLLSLAGHKLYAPKGVGALYVRRGTRIRPLLLGAAHEGGLRPGTENVASIVGLGRACEIARQTLHSEAVRVLKLRDLLWERLRQDVPGLSLNGHPTERLPNTLNVRFPGVRGSAVLERAPEVAASTGAACHEEGEDPSGVLTAMGQSRDEALGAVRLSLGRSTTRESVERAAECLARAWELARDRGGA